MIDPRISAYIKGFQSFRCHSGSYIFKVQVYTVIILHYSMIKYKMHYVCMYL